MTYSATPNQYQSTFGNAPYPSSYGSGPGVMPSMGYSNTATPSFSAYEPPTAFNGPQSFLMGFPQQYGSNDGWPPAQSSQLGNFYNYGTNPTQSPPMYPQNSVQPPPMNQYPQPVQPSFPQMNQTWTQTQYQGGLQHTPMMQAAQAVPWSNFQAQVNTSNNPYPYGQLPSQTYGPNYPTPNQHPLPGSYNRSIFNPQTRSFVPANSTGRFNAKPGKSNQPKASGRNSANHEHAKPAETVHNVPGRSNLSPQPANNGVASSKAQVESLQTKWGTPAHLPKKPPPSQVASVFKFEATPPLQSQQAHPAMPSAMAVSNQLGVSGGVAGFSGGINGGLAAGP
jgi:hypothetical protein